MNRRTLLLSLASFAATPVFAEDWPTEPRDIVAKIYALSACKSAKYDCPSAFDNKEVHKRYFTKSLEGVLNKAYAKSKRLNEPVIDFDPVMNTQETPEPKGLDVSVESASDGKATVAAKFTSYDVLNTIRYDFVQEEGAWKIFDLRGDSGGKDKWSLRKIAAGG